MAAQCQGQQQAFGLVRQQRGRCAARQAGRQLVPGQCRVGIERHAQAGRGRLAQLGIDEAAMARAETGDQGRRKTQHFRPIALRVRQVGYAQFLSRRHHHHVVRAGARLARPPFQQLGSLPHAAQGALEDGHAAQGLRAARFDGAVGDAQLAQGHRFHVICHTVPSVVPCPARWH
ncbi:hypothetical protein [Janthinobacterium sp. HH106]|uniref:hypothetical protein n=1 Tax=Janthinobacterium sp. HH106 TaxID=1537278 RepID=UPI001C30552D|nr:hypothetical protein [Janthinobacterium sp. HH106]